MAGRRIDDRSFWAGGPGKNSILPDGPHKTKVESSAMGAGELNKYEDTTEAIKATQETAKRKINSNMAKPGYRN